NFLEITPPDMRVERRGEPALTAQQLVKRHICPFALNVPKRDIHAAHRVEENGAVAPIRADIRRLPDVFDLVNIAANEQGLEVLLNRRLHRVSPLSEGCTPQAVQTRLAG